MPWQENVPTAVSDEDLFGRQQSNARKSITATDIMMCGLLVGLGVLHFGMSPNRGDFVNGDVLYLDLARSLIEKSYYGTNFTPETLVPPGFPMILASLCVTVGCTYVIIIRSLVIFMTLGFIASYELLCW